MSPSSSLCPAACFWETVLTNGDICIANVKKLDLNKTLLNRSLPFNNPVGTQPLHDYTHETRVLLSLLLILLGLSIIIHCSILKLLKVKTMEWSQVETRAKTFTEINLEQREFSSAIHSPKEHRTVDVLNSYLVWMCFNESPGSTTNMVTEIFLHFLSASGRSISRRQRITWVWNYNTSIGGLNHESWWCWY